MTPLILFFASLVPIIAAADAPPDRKEVETALRRAVRFFDESVSSSGGYVWRYSADLKKAEGEGKVGPTTAWLQPPATPAVGGALLGAYNATGDAYYLQAARRTAMALVRGQLQSGGWDNRIEFDPEDRKKYAYRVDGKNAGKRNVTTLDDDKTQSAVRFLAAADEALKFKDQAIHEAVTFALESLIKAQYPNGAWPQRFDEFPDPKEFPVRKANYPDSWPRTFPKRRYARYYTLNDNTQVDTIETMMLAYRVYQKKEYADAAIRGGDFLLLAQMPEPQPAWAQQYNVQMQPAWARKFEPPAVTGGESQGVIRALIQLYHDTGERRFLQPIEPALDYLVRSKLSNGRLARFYELKTNRPLYFTTDYKLVYHDDDLPTHYGFTVSTKLGQLSRAFKQAKSSEPNGLNRERRVSRPKLSDSLVSQTRRVLDRLDARGRWVEEGRLRYHGSEDATRRIIESKSFVRNVGVLADYFAATAP